MFIVRYAKNHKGNFEVMNKVPNLHFSEMHDSGKTSCIRAVAARFNMLRSTLVQHTGYKSSLFPNA